MTAPAPSPARRRVGVAIVGLGGAVGTTVAAGLELLRLGACGPEGLPLANLRLPDGRGALRPVEEVTGLAAYDDLIVGGWDLSGDDLAKAADVHGVLAAGHVAAVAPALAALRPWPAVGNLSYCRNVSGGNVVGYDRLREQVDAVRSHLRRFRDEASLDSVVVVNLASTERWPNVDDPAFATPEAFERAVAEDAPMIAPAMIYAYAALLEGLPHVNFTPSVAADVPALVALATRQGVPLAGKDGKTGQTMVKTVLAPAFRSRALRVDGWYSTNILGNRDGLALDDPDSLASKLNTKGSVLDGILGYPVDDHVVRIDYYRPRGDAKEAWDNIDLTGFLGQPMQMKVNFLCRDSVLAAPLVIELARLADLAGQRGQGGVLTELGYFFKAPMTAADGPTEHALHRQEQVLLDWLAGSPIEGPAGRLAPA